MFVGNSIAIPSILLATFVSEAQKTGWAMPDMKWKIIFNKNCIRFNSNI